MFQSEPVLEYRLDSRDRETMEGNNNSPIVQFYNNKTVFITGATGFMGKVRNITVGYS